jgi:hypothetical protein
MAALSHRLISCATISAILTRTLAIPSQSPRYLTILRERLGKIGATVVSQEMERLGLSFWHRSVGRRKVLHAAFSGGREAGERFEYRPGIELG